MSRIGDFFNRIRDRIFSNRRLELPENSTQAYQQTIVDDVLKGKINERTINTFENPQNYNEYCQNFFSQGDNFARQYDYLELVSQMQQNGAMEEFGRYFGEIQNNSNLYYPSPVHGIEHTSRVTFFAEALCSLDGISAHDKDLIMRAAQLHDIGREDDSKNFDHGAASRYKIEKYGLLSGYSQRDQDIIKFAVECHSLSGNQVEQKLQQLPQSEREDYRRVLDYLKDADKLDRTRIANKGRGLDPNRLASDSAKRLVKIAHVNFYEFNNLIDYEINKNQYNNNYNLRREAFNELRQHGVNIDFEFFEEIVNEYRDGTLEMLMSQGRIDDILSYKTFVEYSASESEETLKEDFDQIFRDLNNNDQVKYLESTLDDEFMLHYNLKFNHPDAYNIYKYVDIDMSSKNMVGVASHIKTSDLDKFFNRGYYFRMADLYELASNLTPEEYQNIMTSGNIEDLISSKYEKDPAKYQELQDKLLSLGIRYNKETIDTNYRFIEKIIEICPEVLKSKQISNYTFSEIFTASTKLYDASTRLSSREQFSFNAKDIIDFMDFSKHDSLIYRVSEKEQLDIAENFVQNKETVRDPRYVQYMIKRNKPFTTKKIDEILNYNEFCADSILVDPNISLEDAKSKLINGLFNLDVPPENRKDFEKELIEQLYYHKKYFPNSELYQTQDGILDKITEILNCKNIKDFKNLLYESKDSINTINTHVLGERIKAELVDLSKADFTYNLQKSADAIRSMNSTMVYSASGTQVPAKVLSGQQFYIATTTVMPRCSSISHKIMKNSGDHAREEILKQMLEREYNPNQKCTSIVSNRMLAHAQSALQDQELLFGYVPDSKEAISVAGVYDLSTVKNKANHGIRKTNRPVTPRGIKDFTDGTTEEHNEVVMSAFPDFIVCFDGISDAAIEKQRRMQDFYDENHIDKKIELVVVEAQRSYLPKIKNDVLSEHLAIKDRIRNHTLTENDFRLMFERHESNFVLRTLQAIHSTSYREDTWDPDYNLEVLDSMTEILDSISRIVPNDKARAVLDQVDILLQRADPKSTYGSRFYDHTYASQIDTDSLSEIRDRLAMKVYPYEQSQVPAQQTKRRQQTEQTQQRQTLQVEELNAEGITATSENKSKKSFDENER